MFGGVLWYEGKCRYVKLIVLGARSRGKSISVRDELKVTRRVIVDDKPDGHLLYQEAECTGRAYYR